MSFTPQEAVDFLKISADASSFNRAQWEQDLRFSHGDQWPSQAIQSRTLEQRPCLTINKLDAYIRQITNAQRQQRPRILVHPMDGYADKKTAEILQGLMRHIQYQSDGDHAYDTAFDIACRMGVGYFRITTDYVSASSFEQEIFIRVVENPFSVYFDPDSIAPDGQDSERVLITEFVNKHKFEQDYPGADSEFRQTGTGDINTVWRMKDQVRLAEYWRTERILDDLLLLSNGATVWGNQVEKMGGLHDDLTIIEQRRSYRKRVTWHKCTDTETLESGDWASQYMPIIPVYGDVYLVDGQRKISGIVRNARDPQQMYNYERSAITESVAMAPKAKWLMAEGQDEGHANEWTAANVSAYPYLRFRQTDADGRPAPPPQRIQPEPPPPGLIESLMLSTQDLQSVIGIFDPTKQSHTGVLSGEAKKADAMQADNSNFHYFDNLTRSIAHAGTVILDLIPRIYDTQRMLRIIGDDGKPDIITVNQQTGETDAQGAYIIKNDLTLGRYDVVMDAGPGTESKRQAAVEAMLAIANRDTQIWQVAGDLIFRNMDFPGAEIIADRLAAANPLAQIDDKSDIPPQVQIKLKQLETQLQQAMQALQAAETEKKYGFELEKMKQEGQTRRTLMQETVRAQDNLHWQQEEIRQVDSVERTRLHDVMARTIGAQNVAEINGIVQLLCKHLDATQLKQFTDRADAETMAVDKSAI